VRSKWLVETPEETVRQEYLLVLVNEYGFALNQITEEMDLTGRGSASARADFTLWRTVPSSGFQRAGGMDATGPAFICSLPCLVLLKSADNPAHLLPWLGSEIFLKL